METSPHHQGAARSHPLVVVSAVVTVVCLALIAFGGVRLAQGVTPSAGSAAETSRADAIATARQVAINFTTLDYRHLTQDFQRVGSLATPAFKKAYLTQTNAAAELIVKAKAVSHGDVVAIAAQNSSPANAEVIAAVNETITNAKNPKGALQYYRLDIKLDHSSGRWLASAVNPV